MLLAAAVPEGADQGRFTLDLINDLFGTGLDEGYSSGIRLGLRFAPFVSDGVRGWLPDTWEHAIAAEYWSVGVQWDIYTPTDLTADTVEELIDDRPYAGYMGGILGLELLSRNALEPGGYTMWSFALESGLVGPSTQTGEIQRVWHEAARELFNRRFTPRDPRGWGVYEIPDAFMIWLRSRIDTDIFRREFGRRDGYRGSQTAARVSAFSDCDLGNRRVGCDLGFTLRFGVMPDVALEGLFPVNTWDRARQQGDPKVPLYIYGFAAVAADITLYDAFLDGPIGIESPSKAKRWLGGEGQLGLVFRLGDFELYYRHIILTREIVELPQDAQFVQHLGQFMLSAAWD